MFVGICAAPPPGQGIEWVRVIVCECVSCSCRKGLGGVRVGLFGGGEGGICVCMDGGG